MTRTNARELVAQLVYEMELTGKTAEELLQARMEDGYYASLRDEADVYQEKPDKQLSYIRQTLAGVESHRDELNDYIRKYAINWDLNRISRVARAIMRDETLPLWRPDIVQGRTPTVVSSDLCTIPDINLHCGAMRLAVNAVCSVACLAWTGREGRAEALGSMKIVVTPNPYRDKQFQYAKQAKQILEDCGATVKLCLPFDVDKEFPIPEDIEFFDMKTEIRDADILICFGGDGTILHASKIATARQIPVLGVNIGTMPLPVF